MSDINLVEQRNRAAAAYYEGAPTMTDDAFDALTAQLSELGIEQEIGHGYEVPDGRKIAHDEPMLSLDKVRTPYQIASWIETTGADEFLVQYKYDGLAVSIRYDVSGQIATAVTRGDGRYGEDVTAAIIAMSTTGRVPAKIKKRFAPMEIRGEIMFRQEDFDALNDRLVEAGATPMSVKRNSAAGVLRRHNTSDAGNFLSLFVYDYPDTIKVKELEEAGFLVAASHRVTASVASSQEEIDRISTQRPNLGFEIDGIVVKVADKALRRELGTSRTSPRWAIAYKFPNEFWETTLEEIIWSTGRTGRITPVARFDGIVIDDALIQYATQNNLEFLQEKNFRIGDTIRVTRSNGVIPWIEDRVGDHPAGSKKWKTPKTCPNCSAEIIYRGRDIMCSTMGACSVTSSIVYSLTMLDVLGVSGALIRALNDSGSTVSDVLDLLAIDRDTIAALDGFGESSADKAIEALSVMRNASVASWIAAAGIPNVGYTTSRMLEDTFESLQAVSEATYAELVALPNIGDAKAGAVLSGSELFASWALRLNTEFGIEPKPTVFAEPIGDAFAGKNVVITGKLPTLTREEAANLIVAQGGTIQTGISKTTDLLVAGEKAGSKMDRATALGVEIMDGITFESIVLA